jgi:hypothetical protein
MPVLDVEADTKTARGTAVPIASITGGVVAALVLAAAAGGMVMLRRQQLRTDRHALTELDMYTALDEDGAVLRSSHAQL